MYKRILCNILIVIMCVFINLGGMNERVFADVIVPTAGDLFVAEHEDQMEEYKGEFKDDLEVKDINIWSFPYSNEKVAQIKDCFGNLPFQYLYLSEEDHELLWGYVEMDEGNGWICLNAPDVPSFKAVNQDVVTGEASNQQKLTSKQLLVLVLILVAVLNVITVIVIKVSFKKKTKNR